MLKKVPKDIPIFTAVLAFSGIVAFALSYMYHEYHYGNPRSTFVIGFIEIPVIATFIGGFGYLLGNIIRLGWRKYSDREYNSWKTFLIIFLFSILGSIILGFSASIYDINNM